MKISIRNLCEDFVLIARITLFSLVFIRSRNAKKFVRWLVSGFDSPSPQNVKEAVFERFGTFPVWIETGTYIGTSTRFFAKKSIMVFSIEPSAYYFGVSKRRLRRYSNISLTHGESEKNLSSIIQKALLLSPSGINFWLDGHFSSGKTYQGVFDTPIIHEISEIAKIPKNLGVTVLIDDSRCFGSLDPQYKSYPKLEALVSWAVENGFWWTIQHDIFIAKRESQSI